ncbi:MAG TPA: PIG-L deacetylase family protein [Pirellulales bacterium]
MPRHPVAVIAPHPDDESLGCGGTIKHLTLSDVPVDVIFLTRGELGLAAAADATQEQKASLAAIRSAEATAACKVLGVRNVLFLDGADSRVAEQPEVASAMIEALSREPYQRVFCPGPEEDHPDHRAAYEFTRAALPRVAQAVDLWLYEVWTPLKPNTYVPIGGTIDYKRAAIQCHRSQLELLDYTAAFVGLAAYRAIFCRGARFAEAFQVCPAARS